MDRAVEWWQKPQKSQKVFFLWLFISFCFALKVRVCEKPREVITNYTAIWKVSLTFCNVCMLALMGRWALHLYRDWCGWPFQSLDTDLYLGYVHTGASGKCKHASSHAHIISKHLHICQPVLWAWVISYLYALDTGYITSLSLSLYVLVTGYIIFI